MVVVVMTTGRDRETGEACCGVVTSNPLCAVSEHLRLEGLVMFS